jgi:hypothetical protein
LSRASPNFSRAKMLRPDLGGGGGDSKKNNQLAVSSAGLHGFSTTDGREHFNFAPFLA